jgi:hypothetical protein
MWISYLRMVKALYLPRMASCWTGSLRSRRAFLVAEAMLVVGWLSLVLRLSRFVACETKGRARQKSVKNA